MPLPTTEKTDAQRKWFHGLPGYGFGVTAGWWGRQVPITVKATEESGAPEGKSSYTQRTYAYGAGCGGLGPVFPGTIETYRAMIAHPTIGLARAAVLLSILAAEWYAEVDDEIKEDAPAILAKSIIEKELVACRSKMLRDALRCLDYGWQDFEIVYARKVGNDGKAYTGLAKLKPLLPERVSLQIDDHGNLIGVDCGNAKLRAESLLHIVYDREGDDHHGRGRNENCRRTWANWLSLQDRMMNLVRLGTGIIPKVLVPADTKEDTDAGKTPNLDAGVAILNRQADGQGVVTYNLLGLDPRAIENQPDLAGKSTVTIDRIDMGNPGPTIAAIGSEIDRLDKLLVRGWLQPERTLTEATTAGSRADSESHGDLSLADAEATHELIVGQLNDQIVKYLIVENCGEKYVDRVRLVAAPIQDEQKRQLSATWAALLTDPQFRQTLVYSLQSEGIQGIVDKLGLNLKLAEEFDMLPEPPADGGNNPRNDDPEDDKKELSLSAADGGYWFTTKTGHHIHVEEGESKSDALKKAFGASHHKHEPQRGTERKSKNPDSEPVKTKSKSSPPKEKKLSEKAAKAKAAHNHSGVDRQRHAEENERVFAKSIGGASFDDSEPVDIVVPDKSGRVAHGIEMKTVTENKAQKITMDSYSQVRKGHWERNNKATYHSVAVVGDAKDEHYFYRRGIAGSARLSALHEVRGMGNLKKLIAADESSLPTAARRTDTRVTDKHWVEHRDADGRKAFKHKKTGEIVRAKK